MPSTANHKAAVLLRCALREKGIRVDFKNLNDPALYEWLAKGPLMMREIFSLPGIGRERAWKIIFLRAEIQIRRKFKIDIGKLEDYFEPPP